MTVHDVPVTRVLSLTQPWASLVVLGEKCIETRSWGTQHRGTIAIHASKGFPVECRALCAQEPFRSVLDAHGLGEGNLPTGAILGTVDVTGCGEIVAEGGVVVVVFQGSLLVPGRVLGVEGNEVRFGDYRSGRYGWLLEKPRMLAAPVPAKGALGLRKVDAQVVWKEAVGGWAWTDGAGR